MAIRPTGDNDDISFWSRHRGDFETAISKKYSDFFCTLDYTAPSGVLPQYIPIKDPASSSKNVSNKSDPLSAKAPKPSLATEDAGWNIYVHGAEALPKETGICQAEETPPNMLGTDMLWEATITDPNKHNDAQFRYIVHAVPPSESSTRTSQNIFMCEFASDDLKSHKKIDLLKNPERINEKKIISTSLIDQEHRETWTNGGFILKVPSDNILKAAPQDIGTAFFKGDDLVTDLYKERDSFGLQTPDYIIQGTFPCKYNEIVLTGTGRSGKQLEISGIFIKVDSRGNPSNLELAKELEGIAHKKNLPIIRITNPFIPYTDSDPDNYIKDSTFAFCRNGMRYLFETDDNKFTSLEEGGNLSHLMTPKERSEAVEIVKKFLADNPNSTLEALLNKVMSVPDKKLEQEFQYEKALKEEIIYYKEKPPQILTGGEIALNINGVRYVVDKDGKGWEYSPTGCKEPRVTIRFLSDWEIEEIIIPAINSRILEDPPNRLELENFLRNFRKQS